MAFFSTHPKLAARDAVAPPIVGPLISLRNVEKVFETPAGRSYVLRRISGEIQPGEFVSVMGPSGAGKSTLLAILGMLDSVWTGEFISIMGPSGAGKSTLLSILGMLDSAWTGEFYFIGHPVHAMSHKQRVALNKEHIGFVFQQYHLIDDLTVAENLDIPLSYRNVKKSEREAIVGDTLDRFGMVGKKDLYPRQLSGGQQQLVGVARAVIAKPKLILADEPTGNLHSSQGREIMELFKRLNSQGTTIIQVTHSEENARYGNRIVELKDGWITGTEGAVSR